MYIGKGKKAKSGNSKKQKLPYYGSILSTVNSDEKNVTHKRSKQTELIDKTEKILQEETITSAVDMKGNSVETENGNFQSESQF